MRTRGDFRDTPLLIIMKNQMVVRFCSSFILSILSFSFGMSISSVSHANTDSYTVEDIAEAMLAVENQFSDIVIEYHANEPATDADGTWHRRLDSGIYARKLPNQWEYFDNNVSYLNPKTNETKPMGNSLTTFNGTNTTWFNRTADKSGQMRAAIFPGRREDFFPKIMTTPHHYIFFMNPKMSFGSVLTRDDSSFEIEAYSEPLNGLKTIKIVGTTLNGAATMTLWISPDRSFLPIKMRLVRNRDKRLLEERELTDLIQLSNKIWYPKTVRFGNPSSEQYICSYAIKKISLDTLTKDFFTPKLPPNTHVSDHVLKLSYNTSDAVDVGLLDMQSSENRIAAVSVPKQNPDLAQKALEKYVTKVEGQADVQADKSEKTPIKEVIPAAPSVSKKFFQTPYLVTTIISTIILIVLGLILFRKFVAKQPARKEKRQ